MFERFQQQSERIATLQAEPPDDQYTSDLIQRVYDDRSRERDHSRDAAVKHVAEWLLERNIDTVYVGDLIDVLSTHWYTDVNEKTHAFWSHRQLVTRIKLTLGDIDITVMETDEYDSSSECPSCGSDAVTRSGDSFRCEACDLEAHADVAGAWNLLQSEVGPMARPAALPAERGRDAPTRGRTGSGTNMTGYPPSLGNSRGQLTKPASANPQVHSWGNRLTGLPTEESSPFTARRKSIRLSRVSRASSARPAIGLSGVLCLDMASLSCRNSL
jgi:putative transposase